MQLLVWGVVGIIIMIVAGIQLRGLLYMKKHGTTVLAEVMEVTEVRVGKKKRLECYAHKMRYEIDGKTIEAVDKSGYNQPFEVGSKQLIVCSPKDPEHFEYEDALGKNITLFWVLLGVAAVFSAYWTYSGISRM